MFGRAVLIRQTWAHARYPKRLYHSENVFGHRRKPQKKFEISKRDLDNRTSQSNFYRLVTAYREHAHKVADVDPVNFSKNERLVTRFLFLVKRFI